MIGPGLLALLRPDAALAWTPAPRWLMRFHLLRSLLGRLDQARPVVELGYGSGAVLELLAGEGFRATGLDMSASAAAIARARVARLPAGQRPEVLVGGFDQLDGLRGATGSVLLFEVLEHVDDVGLLSEIHDMLVPGGAVLLSVPAAPAAVLARRRDGRALPPLRPAGARAAAARRRVRTRGVLVLRLPARERADARPAAADARPGHGRRRRLVERSAESGNMIPLRRLTGAIVNETTMLPFSLLQRPFLRDGPRRRLPGPRARR